MNSDTPPGQKPKWYFKISTLVIILLSFPPLALPFIWLNKGFTRKNKIIWTMVTVVLTYLVYVLTVESWRMFNNTYQQMLQEMNKPF